MALGAAGYVGGRTFGGGAYLGVAIAGVYLLFAGLAVVAVFLFLTRSLDRRVATVLGVALFLYGAVLVGYGFNRGATAVLNVLILVIVLGGVLVWRDLSRLTPGKPSPALPVPMETPPLTLSWPAIWIPIAAVAALYFALGNFSPTSSYVTRWLAVVCVLLAVAGRRYRWAAILAAVAAGTDALLVALVSAQQTAGGNPDRVAPVIAGIIVVGLSAFQIWRFATRSRTVDPVALIAAQLGVALLLRWAYYLGSGEGLDPNGYGAGTTATPFRAELPLLALALAAIGLGFSRNARPAMRRVGLAFPRFWSVVLALAVADGYLALSSQTSLLTYRLMPDAYFRIAEILDKTESTLPYWAILAYGLLAGISEELLFRGALQPRVGITLAAILFAAIHVQYGLTPVLGLIFVVGLVYGLIRRYVDLTTVIIAHAATDTGGFPMTHFSWSTLVWGAVLVAALGGAIVRRRRQKAHETDEALTALGRQPTSGSAERPPP